MSKTTPEGANQRKPFKINGIPKQSLEANKLLESSPPLTKLDKLQLDLTTFGTAIVKSSHV